MPKNVIFRIMPLIFSAILALSGCKVFSVGKELRFYRCRFLEVNC